jgi:hypothetical protein
LAHLKPDPGELKVLAGMHVQGLFSLVSSSSPLTYEGTRILLPANVQFFGWYLPGDWGNPQLTTITQRVREWPIVTEIVAASGFFKAVLKRTDDGSDSWFWALQWNDAVRIVGALFHAGQRPPLFEALPPLKWTLLPDGRGRRRRETPLAPEDDELFGVSRVS